MIGWTYDDAGNLLNDGTTSFTYDALGRMLTNGDIINTYQGDGVLFSQTNSSGTLTYTHDLLAPLPVILSDGTTNSIYGIGAERLMGSAGSAQTWYIGDALASVRQTQKSVGDIDQFTSYDAWGVSQGAIIGLFGFTGELQQGNSVYLRARWYQPGSGSFGSRDPFAGWAEKPYSLMPYQYAYANPAL